MLVTEKRKLSTLFLDRDGVINYKIKGYVRSYKDFRFIQRFLEPPGES